MPFKKLFGRDTRFFDFLESGAAQAKHGSVILGKLLHKLEEGAPSAFLDEVAESRRKHKKIAQDTTEAVTKTFVTPIDREDIEGLSDSLYKISKTLEKIAERLVICPPGARMQEIDKQVAMLEKAAGVVEHLVGWLRKGATGETIKSDYEQIQNIEGEADKVMQESLRDLYHRQDDARLVVFWKDIYELLEKAIDRCRDAGNDIFHIVLKYS